MNLRLFALLCVIALTFLPLLPSATLEAVAPPSPPALVAQDLYPLLYSTFLGGGEVDWGSGVAVDGEGYVYVAGTTGSSDLLTRNPYQNENHGGRDVFIAKFDPRQSGDASLIYATYLGGSGDDCVCDIAVDNAGNVYVTGYTASDDFPLQNAYQSAQENRSVFVAKLNAAGNGLLYATFLGGDGPNDFGYGIAVDDEGYIYVAGMTDSTDFPLKNPYQDTYGGDDDAFVAKFDPTKSGDASLVYSTYLGGDRYDRAYDVAVDGAGNAYAVGGAYSTGFPTTQNAYQSVHSASYDDVFIIKLSPDGSTLLYSTFLGADSRDTGTAIAVDDAGNAYITGYTYSMFFPLRNAYSTSRGNKGVFISRVDTTQSGDSSLIYSTFLSGGGDQEGKGIAADERGNVYVTGQTLSSSFPTRNAYDDALGGSSDAFVAYLDTNRSGDASLLFSTYLGGDQKEIGYSVAVDGTGNICVVGLTRSATDFPLLNAYQGTYGGDGETFGGDAFLTLFGVPRPDLSASRKQVSPTLIAPAGTLLFHTLHYTLTLVNSGDLTATAVLLTDTLPLSLTLTAGPVCAGGACGYDAGPHTITWTGDLAPEATALVTYTMLLSTTIEEGETLFLLNNAQIADGVNVPLTRRALSAVNPHCVYMPLVLRWQ